jgi:hypothetical protein
VQLNFHNFPAVATRDESVLRDSDVHERESAVRACEGGYGCGHGWPPSRSRWFSCPGWKSPAFGDRRVGVTCGRGRRDVLPCDRTSVMGPAAMIGATLGDRSARIALSGGWGDVAAGDRATAMSLRHCCFPSSRLAHW